MENVPLSKKKLRWFRALALVTPVVVLILFELILRIAGYGYNTDLFIRYPDDPAYWVMNKYASERYFSDTANATKGNIEPFKADKGSNSFRIFVLGESTTTGYPYLRNGSFHRWLQYRLMHMYPGINFEVINVSLTAVNSYTVLDFGRQVTEFKPDAVLIYTGHNEYYGALGVGSTSHIASNRTLVRLVLELRRFRFVQLMESCFRNMKGGADGAIDQRENLMKRMAASQEIRYGSKEYDTGIKQFQTNMDELCRLLQDRSIPVFLSTLVSNEKDQHPFISSAQSTANAEAAFKKGSRLYTSRNYPAAKKQFVEAKELDLLRFRAPDTINKIITALSEKYNDVHLVDARKVFELHSPHQILGNETLLEHVHPNLYGYALLSEAFYQSIQQSKLIKATTGPEMSFEELLRRMPVTRVDSLYGAYTIMMLKSGWPFNEPISTDFKRGNSLDEQLAGALAVNRISWADAINKLFQYSMKSNNKKIALKAVEAVLLESPRNMTYKIYAARLSFDLGNFPDAAFYFKMAYDQEPSFENARNMYLVYLKTDQPEKSIAYIQESMQLHPQDISLPVMLATVKDIMKMKSKLALSPDNDTLKEKIAIDFQSIGIEDATGKYKTTVLK
jgi:tetratricopeptide (TPR) repeat protein